MLPKKHCKGKDIFPAIHAKIYVKDWQVKNMAGIRNMG
jgi:hypothetical protein